MNQSARRPQDRCAGWELGYYTPLEKRGASDYDAFHCGKSGNVCAEHGEVVRRCSDDGRHGLFPKARCERRLFDSVFARSTSFSRSSCDVGTPLGLRAAQFCLRRCSVHSIPSAHRRLQSRVGDGFGSLPAFVYSLGGRLAQESECSVSRSDMNRK